MRKGNGRLFFSILFSALAWFFVRALAFYSWTNIRFSYVDGGAVLVWTAISKTKGNNRRARDAIFDWDALEHIIRNHNHHDYSVPVAARCESNDFLCFECKLGHNVTMKTLGGNSEIYYSVNSIIQIFSILRLAIVLRLIIQTTRWNDTRSQRLW